MDKIDSYWDWEGMICRIKKTPDGCLYVEGFNPKTRKWDHDVCVASLMFSPDLTPEEAEARIAELISSEGRGFPRPGSAFAPIA